MKDTDKAFWVRSEEGEPVKKCRDCIHADVCELNPFLPEFSRDSAAYCGAFKNREEYVEVVRCKDCKWYDKRADFCTFWDSTRHPEHFCGEGERITDD